MATITVTNNSDSGAGSLRAAVAAAEDDDVIKFDSTVFPANGTAPVVIAFASRVISPYTKAVTIDASENALANGAPGVAFDGGWDGSTTDGTSGTQIFQKASGVIRENVFLKIVGVRFQNGYAKSSDTYSPIYTSYSARFENCEFVNCGNDVDKEGATAQGGAVTSVTVSGSTNSLIEFIDCKFLNNSAGSRGGAVYVNNVENVVFQGCVFTENVATEVGGAVCFNAKNASFQRCVFTENASSAAGGAVSSYLNICENVAFKNCQFNSDAGTQGGALYLQNTLQDNVLTAEVTSTSFCGNASTSNGGAVFFRGYQIDISDCVVAGNESGEGGALYVYSASNVLIDSTTIAFNAALFATPRPGVVSLATSTTITNSIVAANFIATDDSLTFDSSLDLYRQSSSLLISIRNSVVGTTNLTTTNATLEASKVYANELASGAVANYDAFIDALSFVASLDLSTTTTWTNTLYQNLNLHLSSSSQYKDAGSLTSRTTSTDLDGAFWRDNPSPGAFETVDANLFWIGDKLTPPLAAGSLENSAGWSSDRFATASGTVAPSTLSSPKIFIASNVAFSDVLSNSSARPTFVVGAGATVSVVNTGVVYANLELGDSATFATSNFSGDESVDDGDSVATIARRLDAASVRLAPDSTANVVLWTSSPWSASTSSSFDSSSTIYRLYAIRSGAAPHAPQISNLVFFGAQSGDNKFLTSGVYDVGNFTIKNYGAVYGVEPNVTVRASGSVATQVFNPARTSRFSRPVYVKLVGTGAQNISYGNAFDADELPINCDKSAGSVVVSQTNVGAKISGTIGGSFQVKSGGTATIDGELIVDAASLIGSLAIPNYSTLKFYNATTTTDSSITGEGRFFAHYSSSYTWTDSGATISDGVKLGLWGILPTNLQSRRVAAYGSGENPYLADNVQAQLTWDELQDSQTAWGENKNWEVLRYKSAVAETSKSATVSSLTNDSTYYLRAKATSSSGSSDFCEPKNATTKTSLDGEPTDVVIVDVADGITGSTSLADALALTTPKRIKFAAALSGATITFDAQTTITTAHIIDASDLLDNSGAPGLTITSTAGNNVLFVSGNIAAKFIGLKIKGGTASGGCVRSNSTEQVVFNRCSFVESAGRGLWIYQGGTSQASARLEQCLIAGNADSGILNQEGVLEIVGCVIAGNKATSGEGGGIRNGSGSGGYAASTTIINSTISGNVAGTNRSYGGIYAALGSLVMKNSVVDANGSNGFIGTSNASIYNSFIADGSTFSAYASKLADCASVTDGGSNTTLISGTTAGFVSAPTSSWSATGYQSFNLALIASSACVNLGSASYLPASLTTDFRTLNRTVGSACDAGAFEFQDSSIPSPPQIVVSSTTSTSITATLSLVTDDVASSFTLQYSTDGETWTDYSGDALTLTNTPAGFYAIDFADGAAVYAGTDTTSNKWRRSETWGDETLMTVTDASGSELSWFIFRVQSAATASKGGRSLSFDDGESALLSSSSTEPTKNYYYIGGSNGSFTNAYDWSVTDDGKSGGIETPKVAGSVFNISKATYLTDLVTSAESRPTLVFTADATIEVISNFYAEEITASNNTVALDVDGSLSQTISIGGET